MDAHRKSHGEDVPASDERRCEGTGKKELPQEAQKPQKVESLESLRSFWSFQCPSSLRWALHGRIAL